MNRTDRDHFTFNVDNSAIIVGQTGSGKTELVRSYVRRLEKAYSPDEMKYIFFDLKQCEFITHFSDGTLNEDGAKEEYLYAPVMFGTDADMEYLEELAELAKTRANQDTPNPLLFIYIEECDMAYIFKDRFKKAVMTINKHAIAANMKLMYSTSRPAPEFTEPDFRDSFDLILCGLLASKSGEETMGVPGASENKVPYSFIVKETKVH